MKFFLNKLDGWMACLLSSACKEVLIKAIALSMPIYYMFVMRLPKPFCKEEMRRTKASSGVRDQGPWAFQLLYTRWQA